MNVGKKMHELATLLFPINRSITGKGVRETLKILQTHIPELKIFEVESGKKVFDWTIPNEWNIEEGLLINPYGEIIANFDDNNLHVVGYSEPVDIELDLEELQKHLFSLPNQPEAIPYVTSYYNKFWGFCISHNKREKLISGKYRVKIKSTIKHGSLTYGEVILPGESSEEVFLSTYVCHPSMANNELSGPVVTTFLVKWLTEIKRKYTYRIIFIPETIGSITYLSQNLDIMKKNIIAGFNISCVGDNRVYSYLPTRKGDTLSDRTIQHVLKYIDPDFIKYSWLERGSDERQYNSPGIDLPVASLLRSKYGTYPEYHTSLDDLSIISSEGLSGSYEALKQSINIIEKNHIYKTKVLGEPQLGKRNLYSNISKVNSSFESRSIVNFLTYCDGSNDLLSIADLINVPFLKVEEITNKLLEFNLIEKTNNS